MILWVSVVLSGCDGASRAVDSGNVADNKVSAAPAVPDACPYLKSFVQMRERTGAMTASVALPILYEYAADPANENPDACQSIALDAAIGAREMSLVTMRLSDGRSIAAQASYRCEAIDPLTTACNGTVEDATARPFQMDLAPLTPGATTATVASVLPGAQLRSVHRLRVADLLDGGRATLLPGNEAIALQPTGDLMAIVAVYTAPAPWKFRKFVWYYQ